MPVDIPSLPEVDTSHLIVLDLVACELFVFWNVIVKLQDWSKVHEITSIDGDVYAKLLVSAWFTTSFFTSVLNVINHQTSIVNNLSESTTVVNVLIFLEVFEICSSKTTGHDQTKCWSPSLATPIKQVIDWLVNGFVYSINICELEGRCLGNFTSAATVLEGTWICSLELFPVAELSWDDLLDYLAVFK